MTWFWRKRAVVLVAVLAILSFVPFSSPSPSAASESSAWSIRNSGTNVIHGIWGSSSNNIFAVGHNGIILHYGGSNWSPRPSPTESNLSSIWGNSANDVFAVGWGGTILHYNGTVWSEEPRDGVLSDVEVHLAGVGGSSGSDVFVVGNNGTILHYDGSTWSKKPSGTKENLNSIWVNSSSEAFAVGTNGTILQYDGKDWTDEDIGIKNNLIGVWSDSNNNVFAVGEGPIVIRYNGTDWSQEVPDVPGHLYGVWGSSNSDVFAVGDSGAIIHFNGDKWGKMPSGTREMLVVPWGTSATDVYVVGFNGIILHFNGDHSKTIYPDGFSEPPIGPVSESTPEVISGRWNGAEMSVPVELNKGQRIIGDMSISRYNMLARITDSSGKLLTQRLKVTNAHVDYTAETSGTMDFKFVHLHGLGSPTFTVTYTIYDDPADGGSIIPNVIEKEEEGGGGRVIEGWLIGVFIGLGIFFAFLAARNKMRRRRYLPDDYEDRQALGGDEHHYHHSKIPCPECHGRGRVERPMMGINRGGIGVPKRPMMRCPTCQGSGWV